MINVYDLLDTVINNTTCFDPDIRKAVVGCVNETESDFAIIALLIQLVRWSGSQPSGDDAQSTSEAAYRQGGG